MSRCTFTGNWNGVDDNGTQSAYVDSIFWKNTLAGRHLTRPALRARHRGRDGRAHSFVHGDVNDLRGRIDKGANTFDPPDPKFDAQFVPRAAQYTGVGYRPAKERTPMAPADKAKKPPLPHLDGCSIYLLRAAFTHFHSQAGDTGPGSTGAPAAESSRPTLFERSR